VKRRIYKQQHGGKKEEEGRSERKKKERVLRHGGNQKIFWGGYQEWGWLKDWWEMTKELLSPGGKKKKGERVFRQKRFKKIGYGRSKKSGILGGGGGGTVRPLPKN